MYFIGILMALALFLVMPVTVGKVLYEGIARSRYVTVKYRENRIPLAVLGFTVQVVVQALCLYGFLWFCFNGINNDGVFYNFGVMTVVFGSITLPFVSFMTMTRNYGL